MMTGIGATTQASPSGASNFEKVLMYYVAAVAFLFVTPVGTVEGDDRGDVFAFVAKLSVGIVLDDGHTIFIRKFNQLLAAFKTQSGTGGILEVGKDIDEFRTDAQCFFQLIHNHAIFIRRNGDVLSSVGIPGLQCTEVSGRFQGDVIAAVMNNAQ
jgi:hypothetical protein